MEDFLNPNKIPLEKAYWTWWNVLGKDMRSEFFNEGKYFLLLTDFFKYPVHWLKKNNLESNSSDNSIENDENIVSPLPYIYDDFDSLSERVRNIQNSRNRTFSESNLDYSQNKPSSDMVPIPCVKEYTSCAICKKIKADDNAPEFESYFALAKRLPSLKSVVLNISKSKYKTIHQAFKTIRGKKVIAYDKEILKYIDYLFPGRTLRFSESTALRRNYEIFLLPLEARLIKYVWEKGEVEEDWKATVEKQWQKDSEDLIEKVCLDDNIEWDEYNLSVEEKYKDITDKLRRIELDDIDFEDIILTRYENIMGYDRFVKEFGRIKRRSDPKASPIDRYKNLEF